MAKNPFPKARVKTVTVGGVRFGGGALALIAGPCVIESRTMALDLAARLAALARREKIPLVFKASYDKANRTSIGAFRGPGLAKGLEILAEIKAKHRVPILVDVHQVGEVAAAAEVADILQLPAFLCRQTDLVVALGESGRVVNIKKGQFLAPWDVRHVIDKVVSTGNRRILLQGALGYTQYFSGVPPMLVATHILGASLVWVAALHLLLVMTDPNPTDQIGALESSASAPAESGREHTGDLSHGDLVTDG